MSEELEQPEMDEVPAEAVEAEGSESSDTAETVEATAEPDAEQAEQEEAATSEDDGSEQKRKRGAEKRIAELVKKAHEAQREAEYYRKQAEAGKSGGINPDDYEGGEYDPRYIAAVAKAEIQAELRAERLAQDQAVESEMAEQRRAEVQAKMAEARVRYPDFDAVAFNQNLPITEVMAEVISESDKAADLAYYLGKNPAIAAKVAGMSPLAAARELGRIESTLSAPKKMSSAPDPIKPIAGKHSEAVTDPNKLDIDEWMKWRNSQL